MLINIEIAFSLWITIAPNHDRILHLARKQMIEIVKLLELNTLFFNVQVTLLFMLLNDWCCLWCSIVPYCFYHSISGENLLHFDRFQLFKKFCWSPYPSKPQKSPFAHPHHSKSFFFQIFEHFLPYFFPLDCGNK